MGLKANQLVMLQNGFICRVNSIWMPSVGVINLDYHTGYTDIKEWNWEFAKDQVIEWKNVIKMTIPLSDIFCILE